MNLLFLRGQVPSDRPASQIAFTKLSACDDMWTQLAYALLCDNDYGEIWYEKGNRITRYADNFIERWVSRYANTRCMFRPDVVFARGGFGFQLEEAKAHKKAFKIYYGAGERVIPKPGQPWDLVLADTMEQYDRIEQAGYSPLMFIKPAAENIFHPVKNVVEAKRYDVIFVANWNPNANKGFRFLLPVLRDAGIKTLHVGVGKPKWPAAYPNVDFVGWQRRHLLPAYYFMAKVAVVWATGKDSCPRVIPEAMASGCPVLVSRNTKLWHKKYITPKTGCLASKEDFLKVLQDMLGRWRAFDSRKHYEDNLSIAVSAENIRKAIR